VALGTPLKARPRPWEYFKVPALMVNAYEIIKDEDLRREIQARGLHEFLNHDGIIFLDSGGYQAMKKGIDIKIEDLIHVYKLARSDFYFSLDYPSYTPKNSKIKIAKTIANYEKLCEALENVIPIVHPNINRALTEFEAYSKHSPQYIAIGGLVPLMLTTKGFLNGRKTAIDLIAKLRMLHEGKLHIMGLGAPTVLPIIEILNCDSTDSASWRLKAAHGKIMLPNGGERYISFKGAKFGVVPLNDHEIEFIEKLHSPIFKEYSWEDIQRSFEVRALFNAWITLLVASKPEKWEINGTFSKLLSYAKSYSSFKLIKSDRN
jgi:queuine/archaeosine tRNA-ribosyltransferase